MTRHPIPSELRPENIVALIDSREWSCHQDDPDYVPLDLSPLKWRKVTLPTADYSVAGLEDVLAIERKTLQDFLKCVGAERERFDAVVLRMQAYRHRCIVIEATPDEIEAGNWRGEITPAQAAGSIRRWRLDGVPVVLCGDHAETGKEVARMLFLAARDEWRRLRRLLAVLDEPKLEEKDNAGST